MSAQDLPPGHLLVDRDLRQHFGSLIRPAAGAPAILEHQLQAASLDLRLGAFASRIRAGFLPGSTPLEERLEQLETSRLWLGGDGAVLEKGLVYLVPLEEVEGGSVPRDPDFRNPRERQRRMVASATSKELISCIFD